MRKCLRRGLILIFVLMFSTVLVSCNAANSAEPRTTWNIVLYLCGSDLETNFSEGTVAINEITASKLGNDVRWIIEAGGAKTWHNDYIAADRLTRIVYDNSGMRIVDTLPQGDMGKRDTAVDFFRFVRENYPAENTVVIFKNHGSGALGLCYDENSGNTLGLSDMAAALDELGAEAELVSFDACLMADFDVMGALYGRAKYMAASEEVMLVTGFDGNMGSLGFRSGTLDFKGIGEFLTQNPTATGKELGSYILDTYYKNAVAAGEKENIESVVTYSVIDVNKYPALMKAFGDYEAALIKKAQDDPKDFFSEYGALAKKAESYGVPCEAGSVCAVDMADLADKTGGIVPAEANNLKLAVREAVVKNVKGKFHQNSNGIATFYPFASRLPGYAEIYNDQPTAFDISKYLYSCMVTGQLLPGGEKYLADNPDYSAHEFNTDIKTIDKRLFDIDNLNNRDLTVGSDNWLSIQLTPDEALNVSDVDSHLVKILDDNTQIDFGGDDVANADWTTGIFADQFSELWPCLAGQMLSIEITERNDDFTLYFSPVMFDMSGLGVNQQEYGYLIFANDHKTGGYQIIGWTAAGIKSPVGYYGDYLGKNMGSRIQPIPVGTKITPQYTKMTFDAEGKGTPEEIMGNTVVVDESTAITDSYIGEGNFGTYFTFISPVDEQASTKMTVFERK